MTKAQTERFGYAGAVLRIDLTAGQSKIDPLPDELVRDYIGGRGFAAKLLFDELPAGTYPFDPDNPIVIAAGPLTGLFLPASGKTHFATKSPATGGWADSNMGGHFAPEMKYAGYDVVILTGRAEQPSLVVIDDDEIKIEPAEKYWGQGALEAEENLKRHLGEDFQIVTIGPAGEQKVRFACLSHDFGRQAGRTGVGAVLGSKNIKAIAVRGTKSLPVADPAALFRAGKRAFAEVKAKPGFTGWTPEGTAGITDWVNKVGAFPTRNFKTSYAEFHRRINGAAVVERLKITDKGCFCCPTPCGKYGRAKTGLGDVFVEGPEYESIALLGGACALESIEEVGYANYVCDQLGLDTISAGAAVGWLIECYEKGLIDEQRISRPLAFGDLKSVVYVLEKIAAREGIGALLADGVKAAAARVGQGSEAFAIQVKGLEWSGYECRNAPGMMLAYCTADVGAHHNRAWVLGHDVAGSAESVHDLIHGDGPGEKLAKSEVGGQAPRVIELQHVRPLFDVLGVCRLQYMELGFEVEHYEELFEIATGRKISWDDLLAVSEKVWHLTRAFSAREIPGFGRAFDYPPERFMTEPVPSGPNQGRFIARPDMDKLLDEYYAARGWDDNGLPTRRTLEKHGLPEAADALGL